MSNSNADIILAGAAAAFTIDLLVYPLDTIKTRYQSQDYLKTFTGGAARQSRAAVFRGLYQGVGSVIVATLPAAGIFFTTYEATKTFYSTLLGRIPLPDGLAVPAPVIHSLASGTAELASCLVLTPAEVIKQNAQMLRRSRASGGSASSGGWKNSTSVQALRMISGPGGGKGGGGGGAAHRLLTGYTALVARNLPFTALQFPIFEAARRRLWERRDHRASSTFAEDRGGERKVERGAVARGLLETGWVNGVSAAASGAVAAVVTTPMDVVKTRMMLFAEEERAARGERRGREAASHAGEAVRQQQQQQQQEAQGRGGGGPGRQKMGGVQVARLVYRERGVQGLFRGGLLRAGWTAVGSGLYLGTYEVAKVWLKGTAGEDENP